MDRLNRRELLRSMAAALMAPGVFAACGSGLDPLLLHPPLSSALRRSELCAALGRSLLDGDDVPRSARRLAAELGATLAWEPGQPPEVLAERLDAAIRRDHAEERWVVAAGWHLARTEALALALLTLEAGR